MVLIFLGLIVFLLGVVAARSEGVLTKLKTILRLAGIVMVVIGLGLSAFVQIPSGHVGVKILFGKVEEGVLYEGLNVVNPLLDIEKMESRTRNFTMSMHKPEKGRGYEEEAVNEENDATNVLSKDGLQVLMDLTILYRVNPEKAPQLYRNLGRDYENRYVRAIARTRIREAAANYVATDLYSLRRKEFESAIYTLIADDFTGKGLILEQLLIRNTALPEAVKQSIENKITAEQDAQRMEYVLQKGRQEAELKRVEAQGIADAQRILSEGLTDRVLQYESIKVQKELVNSPNAKIILLGKGNTPLLLNGN